MKKAVIIGAGPAGLTAAYELLKKTDIRPVILDQEQQVGGMSRTFDHNGNLIDIGGHRFFSKNEDVLDLWKSILPLQGKPASDDKISCRQVELSPGGPDPEKQDQVLLSRDRFNSVMFEGKYYGYPLSIDRETARRMGAVTFGRITAGYIRSAIKKRDEQNLEDFLINSYGNPIYSLFFRPYMKKLWGLEPAYISADYGRQCIPVPSFKAKAAHSFRKKLNMDDSLPHPQLKSFYYPKGGPGQLWEKMRGDIEKMGGSFISSSKVTGIELENGSVRSVTASHRGMTGAIEADYFMSSMAIPDLIAAMGGHAADPDVRRIARELPFRSLISVSLLVSRLDISNTTDIKTPNDIVPDGCIYVQEKGVRLSQIQIFNNWSPYLLKNPDSTVWLGVEYPCSEGDEMWNMSDSEIISMAERDLEALGIASRKNVLDAARINVRRAYPAYFGSYFEFPRVRRFLDGIENLYCIGRNGQHCCNTMDQAMITAMEAVRSIENGTYSKKRVWSAPSGEGCASARGGSKK